MDGKAETVWMLVKGSKGSKNSYCMKDKILELEETLPGELVYPQAYGIFPKTHCDDGMPLDGFVLLEESPPPGSMLEVRPIGALKIKRPEFHDEVLISVASEGKLFQDINTLEELAEKSAGRRIMDCIEEFFERGGEIKVEEWLSKERAEKILELSRKLYKRKNK